MTNVNSIIIYEDRILNSISVFFITIILIEINFGRNDKFRVGRTSPRMVKAALIDHDLDWWPPGLFSNLGNWFNITDSMCIIKLCTHKSKFDEWQSIREHHLLKLFYYIAKAHFVK